MSIDSESVSQSVRPRLSSWVGVGLGLRDRSPLKAWAVMGTFESWWISAMMVVEGLKGLAVNFEGQVGESSGWLVVTSSVGGVECGDCGWLGWAHLNSARSNKPHCRSSC